MLIVEGPVLEYLGPGLVLIEGVLEGADDESGERHFVGHSVKDTREIC
jgi:hypothetical protein